MCSVLKVFNKFTIIIILIIIRLFVKTQQVFANMSRDCKIFQQSTHEIKNWVKKIKAISAPDSLPPSLHHGQMHKWMQTWIHKTYVRQHTYVARYYLYYVAMWHTALAISSYAWIGSDFHLFQQLNPRCNIDKLLVRLR